MKWVTRERPKIDRIACPWLIQRFIEKEPEFLYVPADKVLATAKETGAVPYDIPGVKFTPGRHLYADEDGIVVAERALGIIDGG